MWKLEGSIHHISTHCTTRIGLHYHTILNSVPPTKFTHDVQKLIEATQPFYNPKALLCVPSSTSTQVTQALYCKIITNDVLLGEPMEARWWPDFIIIYSETMV
jgi:hypothetical protein